MSTQKSSSGGLQPIIGKNPLLDNPLNPVYDAEGIANGVSNVVSSGGQIAHTVGGVVNTGSNVVNATSSVAKTSAKLATFVTSGKNWIRLLEVIAGVVLIVMGLHQLTGVGDGAVSAVKSAARAGR